MIYFTSDTHYNHKNIIESLTDWTDKSGCRKYNSLEEMNEEIVKNINGTVGQEDVLYHLGDWSFGGTAAIFKLRERISCENVHLIFGNHDDKIIQDRPITSNGDANFDPRKYQRPSLLFKTLQYYREIRIDKHQLVILSHYPMRVWKDSHKGSIQLYGHCHGSLEYSPNGKSMDVGMDTNFMRPYSWEEIKHYMSKREVAIHDHHKPDNPS